MLAETGQKCLIKEAEMYKSSKIKNEPKKYHVSEKILGYNYSRKSFH